MSRSEEGDSSIEKNGSEIPDVDGLNDIRSCGYSKDELVNKPTQ